MYSLDLIGKSFNQLTVLSSAPKRNAKRRNWLCMCSCGNEVEVETGRLRSGNTKSCGCVRRAICGALGKSPKTTLPPGESGFRTLLRKYKGASSDRGHEFLLSSDEFRTLTTQPCHYCNQTPSQVVLGSGRTLSTTAATAYTYNGVDRKDPAVGYQLDNCVTACSDCNLAKQSLSYGDFLSLVHRIYKHAFKE